MKNPKSASPPRRRLRFLPTPRDRAILELLHTHTRLTVDQIRRLFFRRESGNLATSQAVTARLRRLSAVGLLEPLVVNAGHGAGPYAYGLSPGGSQMIGARSRRGAPGPVWHYLEVAEFRLRLQQALEDQSGHLVEWLGDPALRALAHGHHGWPVPDGVAHWRLPRREGSFLLEWDRGTETLGVLAAKLSRYAAYWRARGHRVLVPGLGLRPRLLVVVQSEERATRLVRSLNERRGELRTTTVIGTAKDSFEHPLGARWWRSDTGQLGTFYD